MLRSQVPLWRLVEIAVGVALGIVMAVADDWIRAGSIRLVHGRNEFQDWSLDHAVNRIGSGEECEISLRGFAQVARVHALVVRQGPYFYLDPQAPTAINGQPSAAVALNSGDQIAVGDAVLVFAYGSKVQAPVGVAPVAPMVYGAAPAAVSPARLLYTRTGQEMRLPPGRYGVGREAGNAVRLENDSGISRHHAELVVTDSGLSLTDLGSTNGTLLNGNRLVGQANLKPGDVLEFGTAVFTYYR